MNVHYRQVSLEPWKEEPKAWIGTACFITSIALGSVGNSYFTVAVAKSQVWDAMWETFKDSPMARVSR